MKFLQNTKLYPFFWILISTIVLVLDYVTGPVIQFPILFVIPVALSSWYTSRAFGLILSFALPLTGVLMIKLWGLPWSNLEIIINIIIRISILALISYLMHKTARQNEELKKEIHVLKGILPICSFCKKIRNENGEWEVLESYIDKRSEAQFSHGLCPDCAHAHYPEIFKK